MPNLKRTIAAALIAVPLALAVPGLAFADTGHAGDAQSGSQGQSNGTAQSTSSIAPVTQVDPAVNAQDLLGLGGTSRTEGRQSITQDNPVTSTDDQTTSTTTDQNQSSDQNAGGGLLGLL